MDSSRIYSLIRKYNAGQCTAAERQFLEDWYLSFEWSRSLPDIPEAELLPLKEQAWQRLSAARRNTLPGKRPVPGITRTIWRYAAAVAVLVSVGAAYVVGKRMQNAPEPKAAQQIPATPGAAPAGRYATLTLAGGTTLRLSDSGEQPSLPTTDASVRRTGSHLQYAQGVAPQPVFHQLSTPNGLHYSVTLSDGSRVWLNAASSLRYPAAFGAHERTVQIMGEAYFEIAPDAQRPFQVVAPGGERIAVLGTRFNVNTYNDQPGVRTTLLDGAVRVTHGMGAALLQPGQQAVTEGQHNIRVAKADLAAVMAWKNGWFDFDNTDLRVIMRELSRWYDIEVRYAGTPPARAFTGEIKRSLPIGRVLEILEQKDLHFRQEGNVIYVVP